MFDEANQRQQEFDQSPSQETEPCGHYGHNQRSEERDKQPAFCAGEREARLRLIVRLCLLMTVHWLDLVGKPMTSCDQLAKQSQGQINVKDIYRFTSNSTLVCQR
jgi:hypothetical protein